MYIVDNVWNSVSRGIVKHVKSGILPKGHYMMSPEQAAEHNAAIDEWERSQRRDAPGRPRLTPIIPKELRKSPGRPKPGVEYETSEKERKKKIEEYISNWRKTNLV